ncbi:MAG: hypothetical protein DMF79_11440 [Acidobacteria bacterium]|nr:MAG: hypothetical protein DMF79_11440 [Acidobacteriota bacterium]
MPDERWQRVKDLVDAVLERPLEAREPFLREVCGEDESLLREVESLLAARREVGDFLSEPALLVEDALPTRDSAAGGRGSVRSLPRLAPGTRLGPYEVVCFLGAGGMGDVYKARDTRLDRTVALKVLPADVAADPGRIRRFEHEARTISRLNHPHICALYDVGQHEGSSFLVMEYLEGEDLALRLRTGPLPLPEALRYATQIAGALEEAHQHGVVHRDLKPANVVLTKRGAKLLDFGIAKLRGPVLEGAPAAMASETTREGVILGTPQYMAPEQLEGKPVDARTDVFAFGLVLYEMVSGRKPFEATTRAGLIAAILRSEPAPLSRAQPQAPAALDTLVRRCLAKNPGDRWPSSGELMAALGRAGQAPSRRGRAAVAAAGAVLLAAAVVLWPRHDRRPGPPLASEIPAKSIAVLPFQDLSPDPGNAFFADGITEDVLTQLAKIGELKVIARTSVMRYKGSDKPVREIARELGVATVLEGSVRRAGNRVRITGQLIDARTEQHLWAETYDRELADIFAIQGEVAQQIATALKASLTPEDRARIAEQPTGNIEAYDLYVKGRALYYHYRRPDNDQAIELFRKALAADSGFALAQAGLGDGLMQRYGRFGTLSPADLEAAEAAARKAVDLNPHLPEAHKALANTAEAHGYIHQAVAENRRAVELHQGTGFVGVSNLGYTLFLLGRFDEALPWVRRSAERDPTNPVNVGDQLGSVYDAIGESAQAEATLRRGLELGPKVGLTHVALMTFYLRHQRTREALEAAGSALNLVPDDPYVIRKELLERALPSLQGRRLRLVPEGVETYLAWLDTKGGIKTRAKQRLEVARTADQRQLANGNEFWGIPFDLACVSAIEGNDDEAFRWLDKAYEAGWRGWPQASWSPLLDPLRQDGRFRTLMRRIDEDVAAMRRRAGLS